MKPSPEEFATAERVVAWCAEDMRENEPGATNTIASFDDVYQNLGDMAE